MKIKVLFFFIVTVFLLCWGAAVAQAQTKKPVKAPVVTDTTNLVDEYRPVVIITPSDYDNALKALQNWQRLIIYDDLLPEKERVSIAQDVSKYTKDLVGRIKLDSVKTGNKVPPKKTKK